VTTIPIAGRRPTADDQTRAVPEFEPAVELNAAFYREVVAPAIGDDRHAAALLGWGSEILGYDSERSTDHGWGPRLEVFVDPARVAATRTAIEAELPDTFHGWPVRYGWDDVPVEHRVVVTDLGTWLSAQLGCDPTDGMAVLDWLCTPQQRLLGVIRGAVFHDGPGELTRVRRELTWYPDDVWTWLVACQWHRIAQEEAFVGRTAEVGDELGSRLVAAHIARELMRLSFLLQRTYAPYAKWFGTAFRQLDGSDALGEQLDRVLAAPTDDAREAALVEAYEAVARRHNAAGITEPVDPSVQPFYGRPFRVLMADRFVAACLERVTDPWLRALPLVGSVDQVSDSTDVLSVPGRVAKLRTLYEGEQFPDVHGDP